MATQASINFYQEKESVKDIPFYLNTLSNGSEVINGTSYSVAGPSKEIGVSCMENNEQIEFVVPDGKNSIAKLSRVWLNSVRIVCDGNETIVIGNYNEDKVFITLCAHNPNCGLKVCGVNACAICDDGTACFSPPI